MRNPQRSPARSLQTKISELLNGLPITINNVTVPMLVKVRQGQIFPYGTIGPFTGTDDSTASEYVRSYSAHFDYYSRNSDTECWEMMGQALAALTIDPCPLDLSGEGFKIHQFTLEDDDVREDAVGSQITWHGSHMFDVLIEQIR